jgi:hypothetical protein
MRFLLRDSVRAFLPVVALAFCHGCGGSGDEAGTQGISSNGSASLTVAGNRAPTIDGTAGQVTRVGVAFELLPVADDADGDRLTFTADNLPPWASFDATTGRIAGTPGPGDIGAYESVTITASDSTHHTMTAPFDITVIAPSSGVATLEWEKPPTKVNGAPLDDLAGYRIAYGHNANDLDQSVYVDDPDQHSYEFVALDSGIWYFEVIAVSASGLEGPPSISAMKSI